MDIQPLPGESKQEFALRIGAIFKANNDATEQVLQRLEARLQQRATPTHSHRHVTLLTEQNVRDINEILKDL